jgi:hypothetical protein
MSVSPAIAMGIAITSSFLRRSRQARTNKPDAPVPGPQIECEEQAGADKRQQRAPAEPEALFPQSHEEQQHDPADQSAVKGAGGGRDMYQANEHRREADHRRPGKHSEGA